MEDRNSAATHYAILIGIDDYPEKPLRSCVRDVRDTEMYLERVLIDSIEIYTITAGQTDQKFCDPAKDPILRPTYENVISAFNKVTSRARDGDFVYIHYSGHGTRKPPCGEFSNKSTGDLALVLLSGEENCVRYFWGFELASLLNVMINNGLVVTLILDCCFSASVYRLDDPCTRFVPFDPQIDSKYPLRDGSTGDENDHLAHRDASMLPNWLINPDRYAILTSCGPLEEAIEPRFDGQRHGALSYFLLKVLEDVGLKNRSRDVFDHLRAKFRRSSLPQNPVLYGNKNQGFFGPVNSGNTATVIPIIEKKDGTLELQAGRAHGIKDGDRFSLCPLGMAKSDLLPEGHSVDAKIVRVRALTSDLEQVGTVSTRVRTGWMARALTRLSLRMFSIRLIPGLPNRDEWLTALSERSLDAHVDTDNQPFAFDVALSNDGEYQILDECGQKITNLPTMLQDQTSIGQVGDVLEHLARFRLVKDLANDTPTDSFQKSFKVRIYSNGKTFDPDCLMEVEHNATAYLAVENHGDKLLYISIYDLGPSWQVEDVFEGTYAVVMPRNEGKWVKHTTEKKLKMSVPGTMKEKGYRSCEDIIKVFITSQPTSFDFLELPKLGEPAKAGKTDRNSQNGGHVLENWAAVHFPIRTVIR